MLGPICCLLILFIRGAPEAAILGLRFLVENGVHTAALGTRLSPT